MLSNRTELPRQATLTMDRLKLKRAQAAKKFRSVLDSLYVEGLAEEKLRGNTKRELKL